MIYRVRYMPRVVAAIDDQVEYLLEQHVSPETITAWLNDLFDLADSLEHWPRRHAIAEDETKELGTEIRRIIFGQYLFHYQVDDAKQCVNVLHFRHCANETNRLTNDET